MHRISPQKPQLKSVNDYIYFQDNIALRKPAWQRFPYSGRPWWGADRAVDGRYSDLSQYENQCTIPGNYHQVAEWRVDLGEVLSMHHIVIYYRTDNEPWGTVIFLFSFKIHIPGTCNISPLLMNYVCQMMKRGIKKQNGPFKVLLMIKVSFFTFNSKSKNIICCFFFLFLNYC